MKFIFTCMSIITISLHCKGWGHLGHQASAEIAWRLFDQETKSKISKLLNQQNFVETSTWADQVRSEQAEWKFTMKFHFENAPDNTTYLQNLKQQDANTQQQGGLIEALYVAEGILKDVHESAANKEYALKFLIHFVADIHQPLHTGRIEDSGGNKIPIQWLGFDMNLHQVWDSQIILYSHRDFLSNQNLRQQTIQYANFLETKFKNFKPSTELFDRYDLWMHESMIPRMDAYKFKNLSEQKYSAMFEDIVDSRVYLAGLRIAFTVNRILNPTPTPVGLTELKNEIVAIVGNFFEFISLKPRPIALE